MIRVIFSGFLVFILAGCLNSTVVNNTSSVDKEFATVCKDGTQVTRFQSNQPLIKVTRAVPQELADRCLFWRQGYEEAKDRFLQMDLSRRLAQGRLAEVFGERVYQKDTMARAAGLQMAALRSAEQIRRHFPEEYVALVSFSDGVNEFLKEIETVRPEWMRTYRRYTLDSNYVPSAWTPVDSLSIGIATAFALSNNLFEKLGMGMLLTLQMKEPKEFVENFDYRPIMNDLIVGDKLAELGVNPSEVKNESAPVARPPKMDLWQKVLPLLKKFSANCQTSGFPFEGCGKVAPLGSNNWAVAPQASGSPHVLLSNDTHLPIQSPSTLVEVGLNSAEAGGSYAVAGVNLPGVPGVLIGHNRRVGWQLTNYSADQDDVYIEYLDEKGENTVISRRKDLVVKPDGTKTYETSETFGQIREESSPIFVRQSDGSLEERPFKLRLIRNGQRPLIGDGNDTLRNTVSILKDNFARNMDISYRWTGHEGSTVFVAVMRVNRAQNFEQFKDALKHFDTGSQNFVYGDVDGNIGYYAHGKYPLRPFLSADVPPGLPMQGNGPLDADEPRLRVASNEWSDSYRTKMPESYNPASGRIVSANNDAWGHSLNPKLSNFQDYVSYSFSSGIRAARITSLLDSMRGKGMTAEDMQRIQYDHHDLLAEKFIALLRPNVDKLNLGDAKVKKLVDQMLKWDLQAVRDRTEPVSFYAWMEELGDKYFEPFIGSKEFIEGLLGEKAAKPLMELKRTSLMLKTGYHKLNDALNGEDPATGIEVLQSTLEAAAASIEEQGLDGLRWGETRRLRFHNYLRDDHNMLIVPSFVITPIERDGAWETVDVSLTERNVAPNFRMTLVMKPGKIEGYNIIPGGNFGPFERDGLYNKLLMWRDGEVEPLVPLE